MREKGRMRPDRGGGIDAGVNRQFYPDDTKKARFFTRADGRAPENATICRISQRRGP